MGHGFKSGTGGGGGVGAVLTVTAPAGVTVSVSKDGKTKTKTANADGLAVFKGLATGIWTLTITDGVQTNTKPVSVTADYSTVIVFFSATINITYPAGSTCTCSDGSTTFTAPDTSGTWACIVPNTGTWTVSCTDGTESESENVSITTDGQTASVKLSYETVLFDGSRGGDNTSLTGGWSNSGWTVDGGFYVRTPTIGEAAISFVTDAEASVPIAATKNKVNLSGIKTIIATITEMSTPPVGVSFEAYVAVTSDKTIDYAGDTALAKAEITKAGEVTVNVGSINEGYVCVFCYGYNQAGQKLEVSKIRIE